MDATKGVAKACAGAGAAFWAAEVVTAVAGRLER